VNEKRNGAGQKSDTAPTGTTTTSSHHADRAYCDPSKPGGYQRAAELWRRRAWLDCGCVDVCRCDWRNEPTPKRVDGYRAAVEHLAELGYPGAALLPECRQLWQRGGSDRRIAETLVSRWSA